MLMPTISKGPDNARKCIIRSIEFNFTVKTNQRNPRYPEARLVRMSNGRCATRAAYRPIMMQGCFLNFSRAQISLALADDSTVADWIRYAVPRLPKSALRTRRGAPSSMLAYLRASRFSSFFAEEGLFTEESCTPKVPPPPADADAVFVLVLAAVFLTCAAVGLGALVVLAGAGGGIAAVFLIVFFTGTKSGLGVSALGAFSGGNLVAVTVAAFFMAVFDGGAVAAAGNFAAFLGAGSAMEAPLAGGAGGAVCVADTSMIFLRPVLLESPMNVFAANQAPPASTTTIRLAKIINGRRRAREGFLLPLNSGFAGLLSTVSRSFEIFGGATSGPRVRKLSEAPASPGLMPALKPMCGEASAAIPSAFSAPSSEGAASPFRARSELVSDAGSLPFTTHLALSDGIRL